MTKSRERSEASYSTSRAEEMAQEHALQFWPAPIRNEAKEQFLAGMKALLAEASDYCTTQEGYTKMQTLEYMKGASDARFHLLQHLRKIMEQDG
jgi:hypothetical protein